MRIQVTTRHLALAERVRPLLETSGHDVTVVEARPRRCELRYRSDLDVSALTGLTEGLKHLRPSLVRSEPAPGADLELRLGDARPLGTWKVRIKTDSAAMADELEAALRAVGFDHFRVKVGRQVRDKITFGGASEYVRDLIRLVAADLGVPELTEEKKWPDHDDDVFIEIRDPAMVGLPPHARFPIEIAGDDIEALEELARELEAAGFRQTALTPVPARLAPRFRIHFGAFAEDEEAKQAIRDVAHRFVERMGLDTSGHPWVEEEGPDGRGGSPGGARIELPLDALRSGALRPYAGSDPRRWCVEIRTDAVDRAAGLAAALTSAGYENPRVTELPRGLHGFQVAWGAADAAPGVTAFIRDAAERFIRDAGVPADHALCAAHCLADDDDRVVITLPVATCGPMGLDAWLRAATAEHSLSIIHPREHRPRGVTDQLRLLGWRSFEVTPRHRSGTPSVLYGGAPLALVEHVARLAGEALGAAFELVKAWGDDDRDIWLEVPHGAGAGDRTPHDAPLDLATWLADPAPRSGPPRPFLDLRLDAVRVGDLDLERWPGEGPGAELVPGHERFVDYCLDARTLETLLHVAECVELREPCLLEGPTSVSKTSVVEYLAMLLGQPLVRLNLNGQTDTGELIGRFVPSDAGADDARAAAGPAWRWQDGLVIKAMRHGWWLLLDELNLAEPQILERLNPVLERHPSLVVTEHDNAVIGGRGAPVHPRFRIFATMNPAEYAGRSALSPAYRDRWRGYRLVPPPAEADYRAMLERLVYGRQPDVTVRGQRWRGGRGLATHPELAAVAGMRGFL
ncbi:MAG: hypothetical protein EP329_28345, partial [Deltaproteobacteria bacterium]